MHYTQLHGSMFYRTGDIADRHCGNRNFRLFCSCDLDLDWMTFMYELDPYSLEIYRMCKTCYVKALESYRLTDRQTDRQRDIEEARR